MPDLVACTRCKAIGYPEWIVPGSTSTELLLWLLFLLPGIVYSLWRSNAATNVCPTCHSKDIVPLSTPAGQEIQRAYPAAVPIPAASPNPEQPEPRSAAARALLGATLIAVILYCIYFLCSYLTR